jgi:Ser/Thr protein kinase RdoA (MazF antagonist)
MIFKSTWAETPSTAGLVAGRPRAVALACAHPAKFSATVQAAAKCAGLPFTMPDQDHVNVAPVLRLAADCAEHGTPQASRLFTRATRAQWSLQVCVLVCVCVCKCMRARAWAHVPDGFVVLVYLAVDVRHQLQAIIDELAAARGDMAALERLRKAEKPVCAAESARTILTQYWGLSEATLTSLPSYDDVNYKVTDPTSGHRFVLKIMNGVESPESFAGHTAFAATLHAAGINCALPIPTQTDGAQVGSAVLTLHNGRSRSHAVRLVPWIDGATADSVAAHPTPAWLHRVGAFVGRVAAATVGFSHPGINQRRHLWDIRCFPQMSSFLGHVVDVAHRDLAEQALAQFNVCVVPRLGRTGLRTGLIHGDLSDLNILVDAQGEPDAVIDFDVLPSIVVMDVAVSAAYFSLGQPDPVAAGAALVRGYQTTFTLTAEEVRLIPVLAAARLTTSGVMGAYSASLDPANAPYLLTTQGRVWSTLAAWLRCDEAQWSTALTAMP